MLGLGGGVLLPQFCPFFKMAFKMAISFSMVCFILPGSKNITIAALTIKLSFKLLLAGFPISGQRVMFNKLDRSNQPGLIAFWPDNHRINPDHHPK